MKLRTHKITASVRKTFKKAQEAKLLPLLTILFILTAITAITFFLKQKPHRIAAAWAPPRWGNAPEGLMNSGIYLFAGTFFVYLLKSGKDNKYYIGQTDDLPKRLRQHNAGKVTSTKFRRPLELIGYEIHETCKEARWREYELKHYPRKKGNFIEKLTAAKTND